MSNDRKETITETPRKPGLFVPVEDDVTEDTQRQARIFTPEPNEALTEVPEAITVGERLPNIPEYAGIHLEALPVKGLKSFLYGLAALFSVLLGWEIVSVLLQALEVHWLLALSFVVIVMTIGALGFRSLWNYLYDPNKLEALQVLQNDSSRLAEGQDFGHAKHFVHKLKTFYSNKPQAVYFQQCLEQLPDYSDDREVIDHIERVFLQPLDKEALRRISTHSLQNGALVAVSPWASLDMLLALWRSIKMIDDIAEVYGIYPSLPNRYKLLKLVAKQLLLVGASEIIIDQLMGEFSAQSLTAMASARIGQGLGAGIYTARIGVAAMKVSRPIAFTEENKPKLKQLIKSMVNNLQRLISNRKAV